MIQEERVIKRPVADVLKALMYREVRKREDQKVYKDQIALLSEVIAAEDEESRVEELNVKYDRCPGFGELSPTRKARTEKQKPVVEETMFSLFSDGDGNYVVYIDLP